MYYISTAASRVVYRGSSYANPSGGEMCIRDRPERGLHVGRLHNLLDDMTNSAHKYLFLFLIRDVYKRQVEEVLSTIEEEYNKHPEFDKEMCIRDSTKAFGKMAYITKATAQLMRDLGSIQSPQNAFPVSYTHLDVYKRQLPKLSFNLLGQMLADERGD